MLDISVIILSFNSREFIGACLDSVFAQDYPRAADIIVIDNGSADGSANFIRGNYPGVMLIENKQNLGAPRARNQGIGLARGEWILTLDCDIIISKTFLNKIVDFAQESDKDVGIIQPKVLKNDERTIYSCGVHLSQLKRFYDIGHDRPDNGSFDKPRYIFGACSAAALYRREMLEEVKEDTGYFDERYFFLVEDVDLSWRAQKRGWRVLFYPAAVCYHHGNSSSTEKSRRQYLCWRNRTFLLKKCGLNKFALFLISACYDFPRFLYLFLTNPYVRHAVKREHRQTS